MKPGQIELQADPRKVKKEKNNVLRRKSLIPGIVYGTTMKQPVAFQMAEKQVVKYGTHQYENTIFTLKSSDKTLDNVKVLIKDLTRNTLNRRPLHLDLLAVDMTKPVKVSVELKYIGKAEGVSSGGVLQPILREILVECLPTSIPESISVDVSPLGVHESLHISDIKFPEGVKAVTHENLAIVTVTVIAEEAAAPVAAAAAAAEPEVIGKGKKPEEGAEGAAAGGATPAKAAAPAKADKK